MLEIPTLNNMQSQLTQDLRSICLFNPMKWLMKKQTISVIGLGYVGLPVSIAFDEAGYNVIGFDLNKERIDQLVNNIDKTNEINEKRLLKSKIKFIDSPEELFKNPSKYYFKKDLHLNILGNKILSNKIIKFINSEEFKEI